MKFRTATISTLGAEDRVGVDQVGEDRFGQRRVGEFDLRVRHRRRVVVDVDDVGVRHGLVHVAHGGDARAEVEELGDALGPAVPHGAAQEVAVLPRGGLGVGHHLEVSVGEGPVGLEVARAAEQVVVDPRRVRLLRIHRRCP
jgi:hypothetical protein